MIVVAEENRRPVSWSMTKSSRRWWRKNAACTAVLFNPMPLESTSFFESKIDFEITSESFASNCWKKSHGWVSWTIGESSFYGTDSNSSPKFYFALQLQTIFSRTEKLPPDILSGFHELAFTMWSLAWRCLLCWRFRPFRRSVCGPFRRCGVKMTLCAWFSTILLCGVWSLHRKWKKLKSHEWNGISGAQGHDKQLRGLTSPRKGSRRKVNRSKCYLRSCLSSSHDLFWCWWKRKLCITFQKAWMKEF